MAVASLAVAALAGVWTVTVLSSGGLNVSVFGVPIRARTAARPLVVALSAFTVFLRAYGVRHLVARLSAAPAALPLILAGAVLAAGVGRATGVAGGSDSYGYLSQAELWRTGLPVVRQPWTADVPWPNGDRTFTPLGYTQTARPGVIVPSYAPGLPLLLAMARTLAGHAAMFWVVPIAGALLVLVTYGVGRQLGSAGAGLAGAWLVATNSTLLSEVTAPMSDVVAGAALAGSCYLVLSRERRAAAAAGGLAAALAVLVRPNLAPTVGVLILWLAFRPAGHEDPRRRLDLTRAAIFAVAAAPGFLLAAWINWRFYGSPLVSGYGSFQSIYHWSNVLPNLQRYVALLVASSAPLALLGFAALVVPSRRLWPGLADRSAAIGIGIYVFSLAVQYLAYEPATGAGYLRFLLPCWPFVMVAAAQALLVAGRPGWPRAVAALAIVAFGCSGVYQVFRHGGLQDWRGEHRYPAVAALARARTDDASVIFSDQHSGSIRYYAGRMTIRYDMMDPAWLDRSVAWLGGHGAHPYALLDDGEAKLFRRRFAGQQRVAALDVPVFTYHGTYIVHFYDLLRPASDARAPESIIDRFDGPRFPMPAAATPFAFTR